MNYKRSVLSRYPRAFIKHTPESLWHVRVPRPGQEHLFYYGPSAISPEDAWLKAYMEMKGN